MNPPFFCQSRMQAMRGKLRSARMDRSSQGGRILLLADRVPGESDVAHVHILEWHSQTLKRVCRSTLQAEVLSSTLGSEAYFNISEKLETVERSGKSKLQTPRPLSGCPSKSFIDYMSATTPGSVSDKRLDRHVIP